MQNVSDMPVMPSSSTVTPTPTMTTSNSDANPITNKFHPIAPDNDAVLLTSNCQLDISSGGQKVKAVSTNCDDTDSPLGRLKGSLVDSDASSLNKIPSSPSTEHEVAPTSSSSSLNTTPVSRSKMKSAIGGPTSTPPVVPTTTTTTNNNDNCSVNEVCGYTMMKQSDHQLTINSAASTRSTRTSSSSSTAIV
ncbi:unnamed protein product [Trichobilharzia regenti]|nr:unnamed protein product [Trichobilharzia regenti]